jgi:hypothetical protein
MVEGRTREGFVTYFNIIYVINYIGWRNRKLQEINVYAMFVWLISHQPAVLFSHNKLATSNQPPVILSQYKSALATNHHSNEQAVCLAIV